MSRYELDIKPDGTVMVSGGKSMRVFLSLAGALTWVAAREAGEPDPMEAGEQPVPGRVEYRPGARVYAMDASLADSDRALRIRVARRSGAERALVARQARRGRRGVDEAGVDQAAPFLARVRAVLACVRAVGVADLVTPEGAVQVVLNEDHAAALDEDRRRAGQAGGRS